MWVVAACGLVMWCPFRECLRGMSEEVCWGVGDVWEKWDVFGRLGVLCFLWVYVCCCVLGEFELTCVSFVVVVSCAIRGRLRFLWCVV